ncbi:MAG: hypothetical protein FJ088_11030, partial [Deltaproteobacteria bacterium]|nr:hypothetical protein [Deltaproteobacteria bacterium]
GDGKVEISETMTFKAKDEAAIFIVEDLFYASHPEPEDHIKDAWFANYKDFHELPFFEPYKTHADFLKAVHYFPKKRTDFGFYRDNPGALRVVNKVIDEISLAETKLRADGYRYTLAEKAKLFDALNKEKHIDKTTGMITAYVEGSEPLKNIPSGDGALWTGCYMAGQAYRYMATKDQDALENVLKNLESLFIMADIPQDPKIFARAIRPHEGEGGDWKAGKGEFAHLDWLCCGNNDMFHGFEYGFLVAWQALPHTQEYDDYRNKIIEKAVFLTGNSPVVAESASHPLVMNLMLYYFTKEEKYLEKFEELVSKGSFVLDYLAEGGGMNYMYGITDWSGQHLNTLTHITITQLAELIGDEEYLPFVLTGWVEGLKKTADIRFVLWPLGAFAYADPGDVLKYALDEALWALKEFPYPKYSLDIDHGIREGWLPSPWPALPWKMDYLTNPGRIQSLHATAYFERCSSAYSWKDNQLGFSCGASDQIDPAADYLHAYWFGRYYGVIPADL